MPLWESEFTISAEEEYQIINPVMRELRSRVEHILLKAQKVLGEEVKPEAQRSHHIDFRN